MSREHAYFSHFHFRRELLQDILRYAAGPLGDRRSRLELCRLSRVCKKWKKAAQWIMLETLDDDGDPQLFKRLLNHWKHRPELASGTRHVLLRENWKTGYQLGIVFLSEAPKVQRLTLGFNFIPSASMDNKLVSSAFASLRDFTCSFSNSKIVDLLYHLKSLKTLRLLQHAERNWATPPRRLPFELDSLTFLAEKDNPPNPGLVEWLLSSSRKSIKSLWIATTYGVEVLRALRTLDPWCLLAHLRVEHVNIWPIDLNSKPEEECEDTDLEGISTMVDLLPRSLVRFGVSPAALRAGGIDDLAMDIIDKIQELPELKVIDIGGKLLTPCEGRPIETTVFYDRCAEQGVRAQAWQ